MEPTTPHAKPDTKTVKKYLRSPAAGYAPRSGWWGGLATAALDGRPVFTWLDVARMMTDPQVIFISHLWRAPFQKVKLKVQARTPQVANFVQNTLRRFWRGHLPHILARYFEWGYGVGGAVYDARDGWLRLDQMVCIEPRDASPRVYADGDRQGQFAGYELRQVGGDGPATPATHGAYVGAPHAFWFSGYKRHGVLYDRPPLAGMFEPWIEKNGRQGAKHLVRLWYRKHAADGGTMRYPDGTTNIGTDESPEVRNNADIARELLDYHETMSVMCLVNDREPGANGALGDYEWAYTPAQGRPDVAGFLDYRLMLDDEMLKGACIPKEVVASAESGSGYNGRLLPYQGFLSIVDELAGVIVAQCEPWLRPLVAENFGADQWYDAETVSLADQVEQEQQQAQKRSGELPAKPGAGGDLPFALSALDARLARSGWHITEDGDYVLATGRRPWSRTVDLSTLAAPQVVQLPPPPPGPGPALGEVAVAALTGLAQTVQQLVTAVQGLAAPKPSLELAATVITPDDDPEKKTAAFEQAAQKLNRHRKATVVQLLALAMVRAQQRATAAGHPEAAAGSLDALGELAGDPVQVARIVGLNLSTVELSALELGWTLVASPGQQGYRGKRNKWQNDENPQDVRYQDKKPGEAREKREASEAAGWEIIKKVAKRSATPEEVKELATHLPVMRGKELMKARAVIEANLRGERKKQWMVQRLLDHVAQNPKVKEAVPAAQKLPAEAKGKSRATKSKSAGARMDAAAVVDERGYPAAWDEPAPEEPAKGGAGKPAAAPDPVAPMKDEGGLPPLRAPKDVSLKWVDETDKAKALKALGIDGNSPEFASRIAAAGNAHDGATVSLGVFYGEQVAISTTGKGYIAERYLARGKDGKLVCGNSSFEIDGKNELDDSPANPDLPSGTEFFANQVAALRGLGVDRIETDASGKAGTEMNGYYSWPRMGYDGKVPDQVWRKMPPELKKQSGGERAKSSVLDLMGTPEGRAWWKTNGSSFFATFDLNPESKNSKALAAYIAEREAKKEQPSGTKNPGRGAGTDSETGVAGGRGTGGAGEEVTRPGTGAPDEVATGGGGWDAGGRERRSAVDPAAGKATAPAPGEPAKGGEEKPAETPAAPPEVPPAVQDEVQKPVAAPKKAGGKGQKKAKEGAGVGAVRKLAAAESDPVARDYLESALHNHNGTPDDLAAQLGASVEAAHLDPGSNEIVTRDVPPAAARAVRGALAKLGAAPVGPKAGEPVAHRADRYQPRAGVGPGDPVRVAEPPLVLNGKVVAKGVVEPVGAAPEKPAEKPKKAVKRTGKTVEVAPEQADAVRAAVAHNALLEAAQRGAGQGELDRLHARARAAADVVPGAARAEYLALVDSALAGKGRAFPLPSVGAAEDVDPDEELPTAADDAAGEALRAALTREPDEPAQAREPEVESGASFKARQAKKAYDEAVAKKKKPAEVARLKAQWDEKQAEADAERARENPAAPKESVWDDDMRAALQKRTAGPDKKLPAETAGDKAAREARERLLAQRRAQEPEEPEGDEAAPAPAPAPAPKPAKAPKTAPTKAPAAKSGGYGDAGEGHPLAGVTDSLVSFVSDAAKRDGTHAQFNDIYDHLKQKHPNLTYGQFHDALREADATGRIRMNPWREIIETMPHPEVAHFQGGKFMYSAQPGDGGGRVGAPPVGAVGRSGSAEDIDSELEQLVAESAAKSSVGLPFDVLYAGLKKKHPDLTPGEFQDSMRRLHASGRARFGKWSPVVEEIPDHRLGLMHSHKLMYYAQPGHPDMQAKYGKPAPAPKPAKAPESPKGAEGDISTTATELKTAIDRTAKEPDSMDPARANELLDRALAGHTDAEIIQIAKKLTGRGGRTAKQARAYMEYELLAVWKMIQSQRV